MNGERDASQSTRGARGLAPRLALWLLVLSCFSIAFAYGSAFLTAGAPPAAPWALALGTAGALTAMMALGASRRGRLHPLTLGAITLSFLIVAGGFGCALALPPDEGPAGVLVLGLPLRTAIIIYGVGLLPLLVLPLTYALTFDQEILSESDLERVRDLARSKRTGA